MRNFYSKSFHLLFCITNWHMGIQHLYSQKIPSTFHFYHYLWVFSKFLYLKYPSSHFCVKFCIVFGCLLGILALIFINIPIAPRMNTSPLHLHHFRKQALKWTFSFSYKDCTIHSTPFHYTIYIILQDLHPTT